MNFNFSNTSSATDKEFSQELDYKLGFDINSVEEELCQLDLDNNKNYKMGNSRTWVGLHPQIFQTPYPEIDNFFKRLSKYSIQNVVDLGAAYGRVGIVMQNYFPNAKFTGFEFISKRCDEGNRIFQALGIKNSTLVSQDILSEDFDLPKADLYFIYDFSDQNDQKVILDQLSQMMDHQRFFMVVRGKSMRSLIQYKYPEFYRGYTPFHSENWSIYSSWCDVN